MKQKHRASTEDLGPRMESALEELRGMIAERHPTASFEVSRSQDEPHNVHLKAIVDLDDADQVLDLVSERLLQLQVEERIPVHVIPIRTPERVLAAMKTRDPAGDGT
jgi:hypothetical protein